MCVLKPAIQNRPRCQRPEDAATRPAAVSQQPHTARGRSGPYSLKGTHLPASSVRNTTDLQHNAIFIPRASKVSSNISSLILLIRSSMLDNVNLFISLRTFCENTCFQEDHITLNLLVFSPPLLFRKTYCKQSNRRIDSHHV